MWPTTVQVVLSREATKTGLGVFGRSGQPADKVYVDIDDHTSETWVPHIELSRDCDLILVYPATVNIVGKVANGIADELISALIIAAERPVIFVPIANDLMWRHPPPPSAIGSLVPTVTSCSTVPRGGSGNAGRDRKSRSVPAQLLLMQLRAVLGGTGGAAHRAP